MDHAHKERRAAGFFLAPLCFVLLNGLLLFLVASPILSPYVGLAKYLCSDQVQPQPTDLYAGLAEGIAHSGEQLEEAAVIPLSGIAYPKRATGTARSRWRAPAWTRRCITAIPQSS